MSSSYALEHPHTETADFPLVSCKTSNTWHVCLLLTTLSPFDRTCGNNKILLQLTVYLDLSNPKKRPPHWPSGKASTSRAEDPGSNPACAGIFSGSSHTSDFKIGTPVSTLPGAWCNRVSTGTGRPSVSIP